MNRRSLLALVPALVLLLISDARAGTAGPVSFTAHRSIADEKADDNNN